MPPKGAESKVQDPEYKNWLSVSLALYCLEVGLHSFIQGEVNNMHQSLKEQLYGGSAVPALRCSSCMPTDAKYNKHSYTWKFRSPCPTSLCDTWLKELLALHSNPKSSKIYLENCDVTAWPFLPWECAKLYMPRGQLRTNTSPAQSDSQALLTLMTSCTYFHKKLSPRGLSLIHMVSNIRNTVMHSGGMRLSDTERKSFIQNIIHLLEDSVYLASVEECQQAVAELNKINHDSLDVVLNSDSKIKALRESENQFDPEVHVLKTEPKKTLESLNEELQNLRVHFGNFEKETRDNIVDLHTECQKMDTTITKLTRNVEYVASDISKFQKRLIETCRHPLVIQVSPKAERKRCNTENIYIDLIDIDERDQ